MARRVEKSEDQKTWEILNTFWVGRAYNRHGQLSNRHQHQHRAEYKSYTKELEDLAERGLVAFNNDTQHWEWTKAGVEWCDSFLAKVRQESEN